LKARKNSPSEKRPEETFSEPEKALMRIGDESKEKLPFREGIWRKFFSGKYTT